ncbi:Cyclin-dependent kinase inhibitor 5 [Cardamine amara subsp. amara]|uniref:Cyclin-dependent kinase inhibitor n=1 Tax=Cardamine amara subsp. amara TaxID=228776 RepID=A0ABD0Z9A5_CARAN
MGKYINKSKIAGDVSVKDITTQPTTTFSSRTRAAKNLALHRLRSHSNSPSNESDSFQYLQLRSRRLVKLPLIPDSRKQQERQQCDNECQTKRNPKARARSTPAKKSEAEQDCNFGEKGLDFESENRIRETTPCSNSIRDSKAIQSVVPSSSEIEDFFAYAEQKQQRFFIEKYNFDIASENPLPGRYEWVKVVP